MLFYFALSGLTPRAVRSPRASPWAMLHRAVGALDKAQQPRLSGKEHENSVNTS